MIDKNKHPVQFWIAVALIAMFIGIFLNGGITGFAIQDITGMQTLNPEAGQQQEREIDYIAGESPVFKFEDGSPSPDMYYRYTAAHGWQWTNGPDGTWAPVSDNRWMRASNNDRNMASDLSSSNYQQGAQIIFTRLRNNDENWLSWRGSKVTRINEQGVSLTYLPDDESTFFLAEGRPTERGQLRTIFDIDQAGGPDRDYSVSIIEEGADFGYSIGFIREDGILKIWDGEEYVPTPYSEDDIETVVRTYAPKELYGMQNYEDYTNEGAVYTITLDPEQPLPSVSDIDERDIFARHIIEAYAGDNDEIQFRAVDGVIYIVERDGSSWRYKDAGSGFIYGSDLPDQLEVSLPSEETQTGRVPKIVTETQKTSLFRNQFNYGDPENPSYEIRGRQYTREEFLELFMPYTQDDLPSELPELRPTGRSFEGNPIYLGEEDWDMYFTNDQGEVIGYMSEPDKAGIEIEQLGTQELTSQPGQIIPTDNRNLQIALKTVLGAEYDEDNPEANVRKFQEQQGLTVNGLTGDATKAKINEGIAAIVSGEQEAPSLTPEAAQPAQPEAEPEPEEATPAQPPATPPEPTQPPTQAQEPSTETTEYTEEELIEMVRREWEETGGNPDFGESLLKTENGQTDPNAVSFDGSSIGLMQINIQGDLHRRNVDLYTQLVQEGRIPDGLVVDTSDPEFVLDPRINIPLARLIDQNNKAEVDAAIAQYVQDGLIEMPDEETMQRHYYARYNGPSEGIRLSTAQGCGGLLIYECEANSGYAQTRGGASRLITRLNTLTRVAAPEEPQPPQEPDLYVPPEEFTFTFEYTDEEGNTVEKTVNLRKLTDEEWQEIISSEDTSIEDIKAEAEVPNTRVYTFIDDQGDVIYGVLDSDGNSLDWTLSLDQDNIYGHAEELQQQYLESFQPVVLTNQQYAFTSDEETYIAKRVADDKYDYEFENDFLVEIKDLDGNVIAVLDYETQSILNPQSPERLLQGRYKVLGINDDGNLNSIATSGNLNSITQAASQATLEYLPQELFVPDPLVGLDEDIAAFNEEYDEYLRQNYQLELYVPPPPQFRDPPEGAIEGEDGWTINGQKIIINPSLNMWMTQDNILYKDKQEPYGIWHGSGRIEVFQGQDRPAGLYNTLSGPESTVTVVFLEDDNQIGAAREQGYVVVGFAPEIYPNGALTYSLRNTDGPRVFVTSQNSIVQDSEGNKAIVGKTIRIDGQGGYYDEDNKHYRSDGVIVFGGGIFGEDQVFAPDSGSGEFESKEDIEKRGQTYDSCTNYGANLLCKQGSKLYICTQGGGNDCSSQSRKHLKEEEEKAIGLGGYGFLWFGEMLDGLTARTRGLRAVSLFYEGTPEWWFELDQTTSSILGGIDGWSSLICRAPVTESDVVAMSFSDGIENAFAHIQGEKLTVINHTSEDPNTFFLYKISMEVNPGSNVNGCDIDFQVFIGDKPLFVEETSSEVGPEGFRTIPPQPFTFRLEKGNGSIAYTGNDMAFFDSQASYTTTSIRFLKISPASCMIGINSGDSLTARLVGLGEEDLGLENPCTGLKTAFFPSCWGGYNLPDEDHAQQQQQQATLNSNT